MSNCYDGAGTTEHAAIGSVTSRISERHHLGRDGDMLPGEQRDGRGNAGCRDLSVERQVRDLPGFLALSPPFPD
jgi:hypothetical protein